MTTKAASTTATESPPIPSTPIATNTAIALPTELPPTPTAILVPPLGLFPGKVAFTDITGHLALIDMLTGEITALTAGEGMAALGGNIVWSGDGSRFVYGFLNTEINKGGLAMLELASQEFWIVLEDFQLRPVDLNFGLSHDGSFAIYDTWEDIGEFNGNDVWQLDLNTGEKTILTANQPFQNSDHSALSPDGTRIAFQSDNPNLDIMVMNADGSSLLNLTPDDEYYWSEYFPAWSPDSARIAFLRSYRICGDLCTLPDPGEETRGWPPGLWVMNTDGSEQTLILGLSLDEISWTGWLSWSPDGRYLANHYWRGNAESQVRIVEVATGEYFDVQGLSSAHDYSRPTWSPDSRALMFTGTGGEGETYIITTYVAAVDGSATWTLFEVAVDQSGGWTSRTAIGGYFAVWSP